MAHRAGTNVAGDGIGGEGLIVLPAGESKRRGVLIWLHGLGDTAHGWADMMPMLRLNHIRYVLPTAGLRKVRVGGPFSIPAWSDIYALSHLAEEDRSGILESVERINAIVENEIAQGTPPERVAVGGFSQGGAVALSVLMRSSRKLGAFVGASTWLPLRKSYPSECSMQNKETPVFLAHGTDDVTVDCEWGRLSALWLKDHCQISNIEFKEYQGMSHSACPEELADMASFLRKAIPE